MKIIIFGANADGEGLFRQFKPLIWAGIVEILAFSDNDSRLEGVILDGLQIISPARIPKLQFDKIIIAPIFTAEIRRQLLDLGIPDNKIESLYKDEYFSREARKFRSNTIGKYSYFKPSTQIFSSDIGAFCHIGDNCIIGQSGHDVNRVTTYPLGYHFQNSTNDPSLDESASQEQLESRTLVKNDVYIGEGVVIFAGVTVGNGAVIGSKSVVTKDVPDYAIVGGIPAKIIRYRFSDEVINSLLKSVWWEWPDDLLQERIHLFNEDPITFAHSII